MKKTIIEKDPGVHVNKSDDISGGGQGTTETVFHRHFEAFGNNDMTELMNDYTEHSEIWTPDGIITGLDAIAVFYANVFPLLPKGHTTFEMKKQVIKDDKVYIVYSVESEKVSIPFGTDSFVIKEGKIVWQSLASQIFLKSE